MRFLRIAVIVVIAAFLGGFFLATSGTDKQQLVLDSMEGWSTHHIWLILVVFGLTLLSTLTGLPVLYLSIALGFFLSYLPALALSWAFNLLAVMITFLFIRKLYSDYFKKKYGSRKLIKRINKRISRHGLWTVAVTRSIYFIPTNIINFSFPLSKISGRKYLAGTMIGLVPESIINVTTGYLLKHELLLLHAPQENLVKIVVIGLSLVLMVTVFLFFRYRKKRSERIRLKEYVPLLEKE